jgi:hypothetical protein
MSAAKEVWISDGWNEMHVFMRDGGLGTVRYVLPDPEAEANLTRLVAAAENALKWHRAADAVLDEALAPYRKAAK